MNISVFGIKLSTEFLILVTLILILLAHTVGGCCHRRMWEGLEVQGKTEDSMISQPGAEDVLPAGNLITKAKEGASKQSNKAGKEGFAGANTNYGQSTPFDISTDPMINTSSWSQPNLTVMKGQEANTAVKQILERKQQPIPLPKDELTFFARTEFKPECCPSAYSNSMGCACMTAKDYNYLIMRGGNNVPYSEY